MLNEDEMENGTQGRTMQYEDLSIPTSPQVPLDDMSSQFNSTPVDHTLPFMNIIDILKKHKNTSEASQNLDTSKNNQEHNIIDVEDEVKSTMNEENKQLLALRKFCENENITLEQCKHIIDKHIGKNNNAPTIDLEQEFDYREEVENISKFNKSVFEVMDQIGNLVLSHLTEKYDYLMTTVSNICDKVKIALSLNQKIQSELMENNSIVCSIKPFIEELIENFRYIDQCQKEQIDQQKNIIAELKHLLQQQIYSYNMNGNMQPLHQQPLQSQPMHRLPFNPNNIHQFQQMNSGIFIPYRNM